MKNSDDKFLYNTLKDIIIKLVLWSVLFPLTILILSNLILSFDYQWLYNISPNLYYFCRDIFYNIFDNDLFYIFVLICWVLGMVYILYKFVKKYNELIKALSNAASSLFNKDIDYIELPSELEEFQKTLNHLKKENEKNEKLALENEQRKNDLIVYLAHDLKTPLTSIIGYLSLLDEVKDMPKKQREKYLNTTLDKAYKLEDLINELFDIARFNSEKIIIEKEKLNLNLFLEQIVDDFELILKENNKEINLELESKIELMGDSNKLARVFSNLIKNAIYYSTDKLITIKLLKEDNNALIIVENKGKEIPPEKLKRIFEKFYRVDTSRTTKTGGSGLGLAIAKEIIELHGGSILATSDKEDTKFYVRIPLS